MNLIDTYFLFDNNLIEEISREFTEDDIEPFVEKIEYLAKTLFDADKKAVEKKLVQKNNSYRLIYINLFDMARSI